MTLKCQLKLVATSVAIGLALSTQIFAGDDPESKKSAMAPIFAVARFASENCPSLTQDDTGIKAAITVFGFSRDDVLRDPVYRAKYEGLLARYRTNPTLYCPVIFSSFGPDGSILPNIVRKSQ